MSAELLLIAPPLNGDPTGGTIYNRRIVSALNEGGHQVSVRSADDADGFLLTRRQAQVCVDTLFLPAWRRLLEFRPEERPWLLAHYLPSVVKRGAACSFDALSDDERFALKTAAGVIATGTFMAQHLRDLSEVTCPIVEVPPGLDEILHRVGSRVESRVGGEDPPQVLVVGHITSGKGQLDLLRQLDRHLAHVPDWRLMLVGALHHEPGYAKSCQILLDSSPVLSACVTLCGQLPEHLAYESLRESALLVSASRMESFGMAVFEARAAGVPVLAIAAGNIPHLVGADSGGELCGDCGSLAARLIALMNDRSELQRRRGQARQNRPRRTWMDAAEDFAQALELKAPS